MPKFKLHAAERITPEDGRPASTWKPGSDKALFLHTGGDSVPRFLAARGNIEHGKHKTAQHNTTQHNTTHTHTHIHGEETQGKETLIRYYASSASWTATTTRVRQKSGVAIVVTVESSGFSNTFIWFKTPFPVFVAVHFHCHLGTALQNITCVVTIAAIVWSAFYRRPLEITACLSTVVWLLLNRAHFWATCT